MTLRVVVGEESKNGGRRSTTPVTNDSRGTTVRVTFEGVGPITGRTTDRKDSCVFDDRMG